MNLQTEEPLTLNQARRLPFLKGRNGNQISLCSLNRWRTRGVGGIVLESAKIGGTVVTTTESILRFVARLNSAETSQSTRPSTRQRRALADADRKLDRAGL